jgi:phosphoribosylglycinamide formyltransferase-1
LENPYSIKGPKNAAGVGLARLFVLPDAGRALTIATADGRAMTERIRLAVLLSGAGTTLQNLLDHVGDGRLCAEVVLVISNRSDAFGLQRASNAGTPTAVVTRKDYTSSEEFSEHIFSLCRQARADLVCMAGFLQLIRIPADFLGRVVNIHPALIPAFCGKGYYGHHVHQAVLDYGVKLTGCTVHFADNEYDHGPIILQRAVPVLDTDTAETLAARVFQQECEAYPDAIRLFAEGRLRIEGRRVKILKE